MLTPIAPRGADADADAHATLKLHRLPTDLSDPTDVRITPVPVRTEVSYPQIRGYEILSVIGYGGMAIVYEARHKELNRRVAIKMLRGEALADPDYRERFRAEAEAIARLQHPNIIQVFEVGTVEAQFDELYPGPFLALEFVDGGSLTQHTYTPHPPRAAAKTVETIARAAHAAHLLGVVHRDLKPANVLLTRDGTPKVADFGIAKRIDAERSAADRLLTRDGAIMGTPEYMAPEQLHGNAATPAIDVYSLGVILYELLTARVPFQGATFADTMILAMRQEPVSPRRLQPGVPRDLETICLKCLEKAPAKRYESAEELADDLARWVDGRAIRARAVGPAGRAVRWARRNPTVAALSVAVMVVAVAGVSGIVLNWNEAKRNAADAFAYAADAQTKTEEANQNAEKERWERYRVSVFAASSALRLHDTTGARRGLEAAPENHRDWVWYLLNAQLDRSKEVLVSHKPISSARFTSDGRRVILDSLGHDIRVCDLISRTEHSPAEPLAHGSHARLSRDGSTLAFCGTNNEIRLYDVDSGRLRTTLRGSTGLLSTIAFSANDSQLASFAFDHTVRTWDTRTGVLLHSARLPDESAHPSAFSPDHSVVATCRNGPHDPHLWDARTGQLLARLAGHGGLLRELRFNSTGDRLVTVEEYPTNLIRVWTVPEGRLLATLTGHENQINHIDFSRDGSHLVSCSMDRTVRVWDLSKPMTGGAMTARRVLRGHTGRVEHATFSPDGRRVVSSSFDRTLRYWDVASGDLVAVLQGHDNWVVRAEYSPDQKEIFSVSADGTLRVWNVAELDADYALRGHTKFVYSVAFHPDGTRVASAGWDGTARVWNVSSRQELLKLLHTGPTEDSKIVASVAYHPTGKFLATLCRDDSVRLWDAETGRELHRWKAVSGNWCDSRLAFSPRGDLLAAGGYDGCVRLWNVNTRAEVAVLSKHTAPIRDVAFSPDGTLIASAGENGDMTVRIWNVETRQQVQVLPGHTSAAYALAWNRAGTMLASGGLDDTVRLWDTTTWQLIGEPMKQGANVHAVAFTPDGKLLAVGCADNLIRIWNVATRQELAELSGHANYVHSLAFSPDGTRLVSGSGDRTIRVWDTLSAKERVGR